MNEQKNIIIFGDSYSTYEGWVPEDYKVYYTPKRKDAVVINGVENTWWKRLAKKMNYNILLNNSYSGSTVCNTVRKDLPIGSSFINRLDKYIEDGFFKNNRVDTVFIFGGTNDSWVSSPVGEPKYSDINDEDKKHVLPAFCYMIEKLNEVAPNAQIVVIINTNLKQSIFEGIINICQHYNVTGVILENIDKEIGHPTILGMKQIAEQIESNLTSAI